MGLFDKIFKSSGTGLTYTPKSEGEAFVAIVYACMSVDGEVSSAEIDVALRAMVFKNFINDKSIVETVKKIQGIQKQIGSQAIIDSSVSMVSENRKPTLFTMVMEVVLSDGILDQKEQQIAEYLAGALVLDEKLTEKIIEVMLIRNKDNVIVTG